MDANAPSATDSVMHDQAASEPPTAPEAAAQTASPETTCQTNTSLPDPATMPEVTVQEAAAQENVSEPAFVSSSSIPVVTSAEGAMASSLNNSLLIASKFESRLHELSSQAALMKTSMHVSTYVSFPTHWV